MKETHDTHGFKIDSSLTRRSSTVATYANLAHAYRRYLQGDTPPKEILDYGAGHGKGTSYLRDTFPSSRVTGYDPYESEDESILTCLPLDKKYDLVFCVYVLNVLEPHERAHVVKEIQSRLTPGGVAIFHTRSFYGEIELIKTGIHANERNAYYVPQGKELYTYQKGYDFLDLALELDWHLKESSHPLLVKQSNGTTAYYKKGIKE